MKTYGVIARPPVSALQMLFDVVSGPDARRISSAHRGHRREEHTERHPVNVGDNRGWYWNELWTQLTLSQLKK